MGGIGRNEQQIRNLLLISVLERCGVLGFGAAVVGSDPVRLDGIWWHGVDGRDDGSRLFPCNAPWDLMAVSYPAHVDYGRRGSPPRSNISHLILKWTMPSL